MAALMISLTAPSSWAAEAAQSVMAPPSATAMTVSSGEDDASQATPRSANELNALPRPTRRTPDAAPSWNDSLPRPSSQTVIVLGIVAGLALVWRLTRGSEGNLPSDLVEVYGRVPLNPKQHLHLVRVGNTLLVLIESAQGLQRLAEISDPEEVRSITERFRRDGTGAVPPELSNVVSAGRHLASFRSA
jgi:flagellar biogenesis protein FliO